MEVFFVYLWLKLDSFLALVGVAGFALLFCWVAYLIGKDGCHYEDAKEVFMNKWWNKTKKAVYLGFFCIFIATMAPTSKETAILVGTSYAVDFAKSPEGAKIGVLIRKKANDYLDEQIKEITPPAVKAGNPE